MFTRRRSLFPIYLRRRSGIEFFIIFISFVLQFYGAFASPPDEWQFIDDVGAPGLLVQYSEIGYECGNDFFSDSYINYALSMYYQYENQNVKSPLAYHAPPVYPFVQQYPGFPQELEDPLEVDDLDISKYIDLDEIEIPSQNNIPQEHQNTQQHFTPTMYHGPLCSDSGTSNYILWPIQKERMIFLPTKYSSDPYYIVIKKNTGEFIDVISKIKNNYHTRCVRIDGSRTGLSNWAPEINTGYHCAHDFLDDELIQKSLYLLKNNIGVYNKYPASYIGRLYPAVGGYMIWPIFFGDDYNSVEAGPYFVVIDKQKNPMGIVVEGLSGNFLRCPRSRKILKALSTDTPSHSSEVVPSLQSGYLCGNVFFHGDTIQEAVNAAQSTRIARASQKFPSKYNGPPFNEPLLLWPLFKNGNSYVTGTPGKYRIVLTAKYKFKGVATMQGKTIKMCKAGMMKDSIDHENSDYYCIDHVLTKHRLEEVAESACRSFQKEGYRFYPAEYRGPVFDKSGPYFTYPVARGNVFVGSTQPLKPK